MSEDADFSRFLLLYAGRYQTPSHNAKSTKELKAAENLVKLWTRPPNKDSYLHMDCRVLTNDNTVHMVTTCINTLQIRQEFIKLMTDIITKTRLLKYIENFTTEKRDIF